MKVQLVKVEGHYGRKMSGEDANGCAYQSFSNEESEESIQNQEPLDECPNCGHDLSGQDEEYCPDCGEDLFEAMRDECSECGSKIYDGWQCLDGGDLLCDECVLLPEDTHEQEEAEYRRQIAMKDESFHRG